MYLELTFWADAPNRFSYMVAWGWMVAYLPLDVVVTAISLMVIQRLYKVAPFKDVSTSIHK